MTSKKIKISNYKKDKQKLKKYKDSYSQNSAAAETLSLAKNFDEVRLTAEMHLLVFHQLSHVAQGSSAEIECHK